MKSASQTQRSRAPQGRAPLAPVTFKFSEPMVEAIDAIVADRHVHAASRSSVVRELLAEALEARSKKHDGRIAG
jgi:Arc/MetJ-type ribon-helix-helix transcriptional regulator